MRRALSTVTIKIGKLGVNENVMDEINRQLKDREIVKVKFSKVISSQKQNYINKIIEKSNSKLVDLRGNVAVIFKKKHD